METSIKNSPERIQSEKFDNAAPGIPKIEMSEIASAGNIDAPAKIDVRNTNFWYSAKQAARVSQFTGFFLSGKLIEHGSTVQIFEHPTKKETEDYNSGRFG